MTSRWFISILATGVLTAASPAITAEEFCTSPQPDTPGDFACAAALADGFGGLVVWERGASEQTPLRIQGQWIDEAFQPVGQEITIASHAEQPMWRPQVVLNTPDEAIVIWADGRSHDPQISRTYNGFQIRGTVLSRAGEHPPRTFPISFPHGCIEPVIARDSYGQRVAVGWSATQYGRFETAVFEPDDLRVAAANEAFAKGWIMPHASLYGSLAVSPSGQLARLQHQSFGATIESIDPEQAQVRTMSVTDFRPTVKAQEILEGLGTDLFFDYPSVRINRQGEVAVVGAACRHDPEPPYYFKPIGYAAALLTATGETRQVGFWTGPMPEDPNLCRAQVAFSGDEPVVFLPIAPQEGLALLTAALPLPGAEDPRITVDDGTLYPLPGELNQFSIVLADDGATGKAAIVATSGLNPTRLCLWPSELIRF